VAGRRNEALADNQHRSENRRVAVGFHEHEI
jgi:hypothetical protein